MKRGMMFIDGSNVFYDWNKATSGKLMDIEKYIDLVKSKFPNIDFIRTYYFTSVTSNNEAFLQQVNKIPYCQVIKGRLQEKEITITPSMISQIICPTCRTAVTSGTVKTKTDKGTDVNIAVEMLKHAYNKSYDVAVLLSRDADFAGVVKIIKDLGCSTELVLFSSEKNNAQELTETVDNVTLISPQDYATCEKNR